MSEEYYLVREFAEIVRRHPRTIYRWLEEGFIVGTKVKDGWLITQSELNRILSDSDGRCENRMTPYDIE
jgi:hypothetical protein